MTRNIPPVRTWRVQFWRGSERLGAITVLAPTKFLARLNSWHDRPDVWLECWPADRITISIHRQKNMCGRR
jgi:hypothetical protein